MAKLQEAPSAGVRLHHTPYHKIPTQPIEPNHREVFDTETPNNAAPEGEFVALHGVFGYDSVADHFRWRETPEHAGVIWDIARSPLGELGLGNARVPGGNIFVLDSSMFHVEFRAGL